jgi:cytochrome c-type biogenesis protein CcmH/NrfF
MRCPGCGHENRPNCKFCSECASQLELRCPRCQAISVLDESLKISRELGMRPLMERVLSRRQILKA